MELQTIWPDLGDWNYFVTIFLFLYLLILQTIWPDLGDWNSILPLFKGAHAILQTIWPDLGDWNTCAFTTKKAFNDYKQYDPI